MKIRSVTKFVYLLIILFVFLFLANRVGAKSLNYTYYVFQKNPSAHSSQPGVSVDTPLFVVNPENKREALQACGGYILRNGEPLVGFQRPRCDRCASEKVDNEIDFKEKYQQAVQDSGIAAIESGSNHVYYDENGLVHCVDDGHGVFQLAWKCACE